MKTPPFHRVLGLMSGTSLDGVDLVTVRFEGANPAAAAVPRFESHAQRPFPRRLRERLLACAEGQATAWELAQVHHDLGRFYALLARDLVGRLRLDAVGLHGQTVFHAPHRRTPATLQLGEPAYLAEALGVPIVANFRVADLAAGGEGAPLATLFHGRVFGRPGRHVCVHNLGGISNVTSIDARGIGRTPRVLAFDTGPANLLLDAAARQGSGGRLALDRDGHLARKGRPSEALLQRWLRHPFFRRPPPKSTGRELFGAADFTRRWAAMESATLSFADRLATLTEFTARSLALNYGEHVRRPIDQVVWCGGGAKNGFLLERAGAALRPLLGAFESVTCADLGWPVEAVEAGAFALLARERLLGRPGNLPATTGARRAVLCGQVVGDAR